VGLDDARRVQPTGLERDRLTRSQVADRAFPLYAENRLTVPGVFEMQTLLGDSVPEA
jgi:hypothetical protein